MSSLPTDTPQDLTIDVEAAEENYNNYANYTNHANYGGNESISNADGEVGNEETREACDGVEEFQIEEDEDYDEGEPEISPLDLAETMHSVDGGCWMKVKAGKCGDRPETDKFPVFGTQELFIRIVWHDDADDWYLAIHKTSPAIVYQPEEQDADIENSTENSRLANNAFSNSSVDINNASSNTKEVKVDDEQLDSARVVVLMDQSESNSTEPDASNYNNSTNYSHIDNNDRTVLKGDEQIFIRDITEVYFELQPSLSLRLYTIIRSKSMLMNSTIDNSTNSIRSSFRFSNKPSASSNGINEVVLKMTPLPQDRGHTAAWVDAIYSAMHLQGMSEKYTHKIQQKLFNSYRDDTNDSNDSGVDDMPSSHHSVDRRVQIHRESSLITERIGVLREDDEEDDDDGEYQRNSAGRLSDMERGGPATSGDRPNSRNKQISESLGRAKKVRTNRPMSSNSIGSRMSYGFIYNDDGENANKECCRVQ